MGRILASTLSRGHRRRLIAAVGKIRFVPSGAPEAA
jgi:hypothetical protein